MVSLLPDVSHRLNGKPGGVLDFTLPPRLEAGEPPEARGLARDQVRLLVSHRSDDRVTHARFHDLPRYLRPGDVLAINTSGTLNAAVPARSEDGPELTLHFSTRLPGDLWIVELRQATEGGTRPFLTARPGLVLRLPGGASVTLLTPHSAGLRGMEHPTVRLWIAEVRVPEPLDAYLSHHGTPIRYGYVRDTWPGEYYQTVFANEPGSAEMPSAGRAFTPELVTRLVSAGIQFAPLVLHTGVASLEEHEPPYEEYYRVPLETARTLNGARQAGQRVVAVGTTVVRALETVIDTEGVTHPGEGWTRLVISPDRCLRSVDALLTGFHEPQATHLAMLGAVAGRETLCRECGGSLDRFSPAAPGVRHLRRVYDEALREGYLWHEFGDLHLLLP